jgi:hypothetical protein
MLAGQASSPMSELKGGVAYGNLFARRETAILFTTGLRVRILFPPAKSPVANLAELVSVWCAMFHQ